MKRFGGRTARMTLRLVLAAGGGLLAGPAMPPHGLWPLILVSVALIHLSVRGVGFLSGSGLGFVAGSLFFATQSVWLSRYLGPEPWIALAVLEGLIFSLGLGLAAATWRFLLQHRERLGARYWWYVATLLPLIWVAREWVAGHFPYGGYQWSRLAQPAAYSPLAHLAFWGGISLVSVAVAAIGVALTLAAERLIWPETRGGAGARWALAPAAGLTVLALITPLLWGSLPSQHLRVVAIQGNANAGLFANPVPGSILSKHLTETAKYLAAKGNDYDLMVWPENSSDVDPLRYPLADLAIRSVVARTQKPLLVGAVTDGGRRVYNSGLLYLPGRVEPLRYDKLRPVPFGEYVPDRAFWRGFAPNLIDLIQHGYTPGKRPGVLSMPVGKSAVKIGDLICFEIGIDEISNDLVKNGAQFIVSQANNSDFGHTDQAFQQAALVRLQAIASGRSVVHASTVATTTIIDAHGDTLATTTPFQASYAEASVPVSSALTPAMTLFGWVDWLALAAVALVLIFWILRLTLRLVSGKPQPSNLVSFETERKAAVLNTLVIMPTYNESESIRRIAGHLLANVSEVDLLIVDDNSPDGTGKIADEMAAADSRVHVLHRTEKNGLGPAYLAGFAWGFERGYEYLVEMDADGSHRAEDLRELLKVAPNNDLVIGSRWVKGGTVVNWPLSRQLISRTGNIYARVALGTHIRDITAGFRVFRASFLKSLDLSAIASAGYSFQVEMAWRCYKAKARIQEVPITFVEREAGQSKMSQRIVIEALLRVTRWGLERVTL